MAGTKKSAGKIFSLVFTVAWICLMTAVIIPGVMGVSTVDLGSAGNFTILAESGITTTGTTTINGDIGVSPVTSTALTGFGQTLDPSGKFSTSTYVNGRIYASDYAPPTPADLTTAVSNMVAAYTEASTRGPPDHTDIGSGGDISGLTLAPGLYKFTGAVTIPNDVTLSGNSGDIWIFQIPGALDISSGKHVILSGGARAQNIFWVVGGATTLESTSGFNGTILDKTAITLGSGARLNGRALAQSAITLDGNTVSPPPVANFTFTPASGPAYLHVVFTDTSTSAVTIASRAWTFGDVGSSTDANPVHTYTGPGSFTVTLTVTDVNGASDTKSVANAVTVTQPTLEITITNVPFSLALNSDQTSTNTDIKFFITSSANWQVTAYDADSNTNGFMTNYSSSPPGYSTPATHLSQPFMVRQNSINNYVNLPTSSGSATLIQTGTPEVSGTAYPLGVRQEVKLTDPRLPGSNVYRIVVTLTASNV